VALKNQEIKEIEMNRVLDEWIKARVTSEFKEIIQEYCIKNDMNISELIRAALIRYMGVKEE